MPSFVTYHVRLGAKRTTVSVDKTLSALLALKLTKGEEHADEHGNVRAWLQAQIDADLGAFVTGVSQRLGELVALEIAAPSLREAYWDKAIATQGRRRRTA